MHSAIIRGGKSPSKVVHEIHNELVSPRAWCIQERQIWQFISEIVGEAPYATVIGI